MSRPILSLPVKTVAPIMQPPIPVQNALTLVTRDGEITQPSKNSWMNFFDKSRLKYRHEQQVDYCDHNALEAILQYCEWKEAVVGCGLSHFKIAYMKRLNGYPVKLICAVRQDGSSNPFSTSKCVARFVEVRAKMTAEDECELDYLLS